VPLLLKSLSTRGRIFTKNLVLFSKIKQFYGLGTGLELSQALAELYTG